MVVEQVTDGFKQAVKLDDSRDTPSMTAQQSIRLQRPRSRFLVYNIIRMLLSH